jgi:membrane associated rhomboid family serine protease
MRQLTFAALGGIAGMAIAAILVRYVAAGDTSISENWLVAGAVLPVFGVVLGTVLAHRLSSGVDPWPVTTLARRIPFAILGGVLGALTWYVCYTTLSSIWNHLNFWQLALNPATIPALSSQHESASATSAPILMYVVIGLVAGAWVTDSAIKRKWL